MNSGRHSETAPRQTRVTDLWVQHPRGRIFAKRWTPEPSTDLPPIVLFHDSLGSVDLWREFPDVLSRATGRTVFAYDRLGFGRSDARSGQPTLDFVAEEAREYFPIVRDRLGIGEYVALGHSVGGGMAIHCAAELGGCQALVTIAAQVFAEDRTLNGIRAARTQFEDPAQLTRLEKYHGAKARWVVDAWTENWLDPGFATWSLEGVLKRVRCPVLTVHGENDEYGSTLHAQRIGQWCSGPVQARILPGIGHLPQREQPQQVATMIENWLRSLCRR